MSASSPKTWLVAYDIRDPRRLNRIHRMLRKIGFTAQYSALSVQADDRQIARIIEEIRALIDQKSDDVRAYHIPTRCSVWRLGTQELPPGIILDGPEAVRLIQGVGCAETFAENVVQRASE